MGSVWPQNDILLHLFTSKICTFVDNISGHLDYCSYKSVLRQWIGTEAISLKLHANQQKRRHSEYWLTCLWVASRTLRTLPLRGKTPYLSRPITPRPATANDLAESPSVKIRVQPNEFFVPASLASSNFGIPFSFECFDPWHFFCSWVWALNLIQVKIPSMIPHLTDWREIGNRFENKITFTALSSYVPLMLAFFHLHGMVKS